MTTDTLQLFDLTDRTAIITGGAGLLGVEHGHALAEQGATVILADLDDGALQRAVSAINNAGHRGNAHARVMDVTSEAGIVAIAHEMDREFGGVHILVNNAAIDPKVQSDGLIESSRLEHFSLDAWRLQVDVGLTGAFLCAKVFGTRMAQVGHGVILNIASDLSVFAPDQRLYQKPGLPWDHQPVKPVTYSVIKTGLLGLNRYLATYWAERNVRSNALSPGGVHVNQDEAFVTRLSRLIPLGRMARRSEYRAAVQFLCSDASQYMTGQNIVIDGGRSVW
jgi:NAD(P)-dependent dehydrogenase (short-subunit alcohol dehydrogenase family)